MSGADYRRIVRKGRRVPGRVVVAYVDRAAEDTARFGFIVSRAVGGAVQRNTVRRRLKAACAGILVEAPGRAVVFRALPAAATASWSELSDEVSRAVLGSR